MTQTNKEFLQKLINGTLSSECYEALSVQNIVKINCIELRHNHDGDYSIFMNIDNQRVIELGNFNFEKNSSINIVLPEESSIPFPFILST